MTAPDNPALSGVAGPGQLRVDLPSDNWVILANPAEVSEDRRSKFHLVASETAPPAIIAQQAEIALAQIMATGATPELLSIVAMAEASPQAKKAVDWAGLECLVETWSFEGEAVPRHNPQWKQIIGGHDYDTVLAKVTERIRSLWLDTTTATPEDGTPFVPSKESVRQSVDEAVAASPTQPPPHGGAPTPSSDSPAGTSPPSPPPPPTS